MDLAKYRNLFLEEATEHLAEMSRALLTLEKDPADRESIDLVFRMAHSIKGMAGSLGYDAITEVSHRLEDRMDEHRTAGNVRGGQGLPQLFRGLEGLERMVEAVRRSPEPPAPEPALVEALSAASPNAGAGAETAERSPPEAEPKKA